MEFLLFGENITMLLFFHQMVFLPFGEKTKNPSSAQSDDQLKFHHFLDFLKYD
jgi:hypothetical protein